MGPRDPQCREERDVSWQDRAACKGADAELFFGRDGEPRAERAMREARARAICDLCPVSARCLGEALTNSIRYGIWGGLTEEQRADERPRARLA